MNEIFECTICFENYDTKHKIPYLLPCQHTFCSQCLPNLKQKSLINVYRIHDCIQCPICRHTHFIRVQDVPKSRLLMNLIEATRGNQQQILDLFTTNEPSTKTIQPKGKFFNTTQMQQTKMTPSNDFVNKWNCNKYLRNLFNEIDKDKNNKISFNELQEALNSGQMDNYFNVKTVQLLFDKYDIKRDGEITYDEFNELYNYLNSEYTNFVEFDVDSNGSLDADELSRALTKRDYKLTHSFYKFIEDTMKETNKNGITFDNYCRLVARFDYLTNVYAQTPRYRTFFTLENYLRKTFFYNFW